MVTRLALKMVARLALHPRVNDLEIKSREGLHVTPKSTVAAGARAPARPTGFQCFVSFGFQPVLCHMRAVVRSSATLIAKTIPEPVPGAGQVLLRTLACGICGSDLHALVHAERRRILALRAGFANTMDPGRDVVFGHEFCGEIIGYGPDTRRELPIGTRVVAMPLARGLGGIETIGFSNNFSGGIRRTSDRHGRAS